jgi:hypothetical protein
VIDGRPVGRLRPEGLEPADGADGLEPRIGEGRREYALGEGRERGRDPGARAPADGAKAGSLVAGVRRAAAAAPPAERPGVVAAGESQRRREGAEQGGQDGESRRSSRRAGPRPHAAGSPGAGARAAPFFSSKFHFQIS